MKLGTHEIGPEPIVFPGNESGYLRGYSGGPGTICGFFAPGIPVFRCIRCGQLFQPVSESLYDAVPLAEAEWFRVPEGAVTLELVQTHSRWVCEDDSSILIDGLQ